MLQPISGLLRRRSTRLAVALAFVSITAPRTASAGEDEQARADELLRRFAPTFVQHVAKGDAGRDRPVRIDFDGDWVLWNNWDNQPRVGRGAPAHVYGAAVLTGRHAYLSYHLFYPRDWARPFCLPYVCHENDLESILLVVDLAASGGAALLLAETKTHHDYLGVPGAQVALDPDGRPMARIEAYGHGLHVCRPGDEACRPGRQRIRYAPGEQAQVAPPRPAGERVAYELLSLHDTLWRHRSAAGALAATRWSMQAPDAPVGWVDPQAGRVGAPMGVLMASSKYGGAARPPWGLKILARRGDWFLDPAAVTLSRYQLPGAEVPQARQYTYHPFLADLRRECEGEACTSLPAAGAVASRRRVASPCGAGVSGVVPGLLLFGGVWQRRRRTARPPRALT